MAIWVAMLGLNPSEANRTMFGDARGVYVWVGARAENEAQFRDIIQTELSQKRLSLNELTDVMSADVALEDNSRSGDPRFRAFVDSARSASNLVFDTTYFFYEGSGDGNSTGAPTTAG